LEWPLENRYPQQSVRLWLQKIIPRTTAINIRTCPSATANNLFLSPEQSSPLNNPLPQTPMFSTQVIADVFRQLLRKTSRLFSPIRPHPFPTQKTQTHQKQTTPHPKKSLKKASSFFRPSPFSFQQKTQEIPKNLFLCIGSDLRGLICLVGFHPTPLELCPLGPVFGEEITVFQTSDSVA